MNNIESQVTVNVTFYYEHDMWNKHHTININKTHSIKLNKNNPNHIQTSYILKLNNSKIQEIKAIIMKCLEKNRNSYLFLRIEVEMMKNNWGFCEKHGEFKSDMNGQDNE